MTVVAILLCALVLVSRADAQHRLTETELLEAVARDGRVTAILNEPVAVARADRGRAGLPPNMVVSFEREAPDGGSDQTTWSGSWAPPLDGRRGLAVRAADAGFRAAEFDVEASRLEVRVEVRAAFAAWSIAFERAGSTARLTTSVDRIVRQMEERASRGEASGLAARRVALAGAEFRAESARAAAALERARATVSGWLPDLPAGASPERPSLPPTPGTAPPAESLPSVEARRLEIQAAEASLHLRNRFWETPVLTFGWQTIREAPGHLDGPVVGVSWPLPLFDRNQPERALAEERLVAARSRHELAVSRASARLEGARAAYAQLRGTAESLRDVELLADQAVTSATAMFEAGESDVTDLLETLRGAISGFDASLDLFAQALEAHRELELAAGRALPLTEGDSR